MKAKLIEHNSDAQLDHGCHGYADTKKHLEVGQIYDVVVETHDWHTNYCIDGKAFNSVCFDIIGDAEAEKEVNGDDGLPKKLKAIIADTPNVFICRIGTDPKTTDTGIANIIPQGIDRDNRDRAIKLTNRLVECYNAATLTPERKE